MNILITGVNGLLGTEILFEAIRRRHTCIGIGRKKLVKITKFRSERYVCTDIMNISALEKLFNNVRPDVVIHCAAWTDVNSAELKENRVKVYDTNVKATANIVNICKKYGAKMIYISTDYVFDGKGIEPWDEHSKNIEPINYYGYTKLLGEQVVFNKLKKSYIIRTSWLFGANGDNFVKKLMFLILESNEVRVVNDQVGIPTYTKDLAKSIIDIAESDYYGYYHITNTGNYVSRFEIAKEIYSIIKLKMNKEESQLAKLLPVSSEEFSTISVKRPLNSRLNITRFYKNGFKPLKDWRNAIHEYLDELIKRM